MTKMETQRSLEKSLSPQSPSYVIQEEIKLKFIKVKKSMGGDDNKYIWVEVKTGLVMKSDKNNVWAAFQRMVDTRNELYDIY